jgi:hypothetical protein
VLLDQNAEARIGHFLSARGHDVTRVADEDGDITIFELGAEHSEPVAEVNMGSSVYSTPVAAGDTLYISTRDRLFAIGLPK